MLPLRQPFRTDSCRGVIFLLGVLPCLGSLSRGRLARQLMLGSRNRVPRLLIPCADSVVDHGFFI